MLSTLKGFLHHSLHTIQLMASFNNGDGLRRSTRLLHSRNITLTSTQAISFRQETVDSSILAQRHEMVTAMDVNTTNNELMELDTSATDMVALDMLHEQGEQASKTKRKVKHKKRGISQTDIQVNEYGGEFVPDKKPRRKRAPKPEPVYVIPDVEHKETAFKGRLGS